MKKPWHSLLLLFLLICRCTMAHCISFESKLEDGDTFYAMHFEDAIPSHESEAFEIGFRVCKLPESEQVSSNSWGFQYDLVLANKTNESLNNLCFQAHFKDNMQIILASCVWYNEPMDLNAYNNDDLSYIGLYSWSPLVVLSDLGILGDISINDFYDLIIDITWDTGSEIILLNQDAVFIPEKMANELPEYAPLDQAEIAKMLDKGIQIRIAEYGG